MVQKQKENTYLGKENVFDQPKKGLKCTLLTICHVPFLCSQERQETCTTNERIILSYFMALTITKYPVIYSNKIVNHRILPKEMKKDKSLSAP